MFPTILDFLKVFFCSFKSFVNWPWCRLCRELSGTCSETSSRINFTRIKFQPDKLYPDKTHSRNLSPGTYFGGPQVFLTRKNFPEMKRLARPYTHVKFVQPTPNGCKDTAIWKSQFGWISFWKKRTSSRIWSRTSNLDSNVPAFNK